MADNSAVQSTSHSAADGEPLTLPPRTALRWALGAALGTAAAAILYQAAPGLGWPLFVAASALALLLVERPGLRELLTRRYAAVGLACLISGAAAVTNIGIVQLLVYAATLWLGAVVACLSGGLPPESLLVGRLAGAPFVAPVLVLRATTDSVGEGIGVLGTERSVPPLRGVALALPLVAILVALLGEADPSFRSFRDAAWDLVTNLTGLGRVIFGVAVALLSVGYLGLLRQEGARPFRWRLADTPEPRHTDVERLIVLGSVAALFALFLVLQVASLFGNPGGRPGSGVTLAEAVHRGFTEMSVGVALVAAVLALLERRALRGAREAWVAATVSIVIIECLVLLASAYHRLVAYEEAYGYTELRMAVRLYIGFLGVTVALLAVELNRGFDAARLCWRVVVAALAALAVAGYWNYSAWIVGANIERYSRTGNLDAAYLARTEDDGLPELVALLPRLGASSRAELLTKIGGEPGADSSAWFEWNLRRSAARAARREIIHAPR